jgi:S-DNA-T family DNA segregation ATPase FtsK/SpoIIIE
MEHITGITAFFSTYKIPETKDDPFTTYKTANGREGYFDLIETIAIKPAQLQTATISIKKLLLIATGESSQEKAIQMLFQTHGNNLGCRGIFNNFLEKTIFLNIVKMQPPESTSKAVTTASVKDETVQPYQSIAQAAKTSTANQCLQVFKKMGIEKSAFIKQVQALQIDTLHFKIPLSLVHKALQEKVVIELQSHIAKGDITVMQNTNTGLVEIQIPRKDRQFLNYDPAYIDKNLSLPIYIGLDTSGNHVSIDLDTSSTPHVIIAGQTGGGKSEGLKVITETLIHTKKVEFVMIDPKRVELTPYKKRNDVKFWNNIKTITENGDILPTLQALCTEMESRYDALEQAGLRKWEGNHIVLIIDEFADIAKSVERVSKKTIQISYFENAQVTANDTGIVLTDEDGKQKTLSSFEMSYVCGIKGLRPAMIKIIESEYADAQILGSEFTRLISRLTALGRAANIHVIAATQRPDAKIFAGDINANVPVKICFSVDSDINSRIVLGNGCPFKANKLLHKGDCIVKVGQEIVRVQSAKVAEKEKAAMPVLVPKQPQLFTQ